MVYTCAYFSQPTLTLEEAQVAKMDHVCRKLRLQSGQVVLEAGCGWGAFALHMAKQYGVIVKAFNISHEQIAYARATARQNGLHDRVEFIEDDWRNMQHPCDVFVSVGMLEHVGVDNYDWLADVIHRCLTPRGYGLIHSIGQNYPQRLDPWIERRIFPGAHPPTLRQMMDKHVAQFCDFLRQRRKVRCSIPRRFIGHAYQLYQRIEPKLFDDGVVLVGDAAGLAYPQSGEGIRPAVESGLKAADVILAAAGNYRREDLATYQERIIRRFGKPGSENQIGWLPASWRNHLAARLLATRWFAKHVVINSWFLHNHQTPLSISSSLYGSEQQPENAVVVPRQAAS